MAQYFMAAVSVPGVDMLLLSDYWIYYMFARKNGKSYMNKLDTPGYRERWPATQPAPPGLLESLKPEVEQMFNGDPER